jgi:hypothetical protein
MVKRIRKPRSVTLNPELVRRLQLIGAAEGEPNLSRLIDAAIGEFVRRRWRPELEKSARSKC